MKKQKNLLTILLAILLTSIGYSNDTELFSTDTDEFIKELGEFMNSSNREDDKQIFSAFEKAFVKGTYAKPEIEQIISTSNKMMELKMSAHPYFGRYLQSLTIIKNKTNIGNNFNAWHESLNGVLNGIEGRAFKSYVKMLEFSYRFFEANFLKYTSKGNNWFVGNATFTFKFENEPSVILEKTNLKCTRKDNEIIINDTKGEFFPLTNTWKGTGGTASWARKEMPDTYVEFSTYQIDLSKATYVANDTKLHFPEYLGSKTVTGKFSDKLTASNNTTFPAFQSTSNTLRIENIGGGIEFIGGLSIEGKKLYGKGTKEEKANINIYNSTKKLVFQGSALLFNIKKGEGFHGDGLEAKLYVGKDSIYHPSSNIKFDAETKVLSLTRGKRGRDRNPFNSSFHNMNIGIDRIDWNVESDEIELGKKVPNFIDANKRITFESKDYFNEGEYLRFQAGSSTHPIALLKILCEKQQKRVLDADEVAKFLNPRFDITSIQSLVYDLMSKGFIIYDKDDQTIEVLDKIYLYADAAQKKTDFDNIKIISETEETNAILNLENSSLTINGAKSFEFSPEKRIAARPANKKIVVNENRQLQFDGELFAGFGIFEGKGYTFDYDKFEMKMDSVRFMDLYLPTGGEDERGNPIALSMGSRIEYVSGTLLMDSPNNKAGLNEIEMFPSFNSKGESFVFYDQKEVQKGIYKRDNFFFALDEFSLNNMDKYMDSDIKFKGRLESAGIFPDIKETLVKQEDQSLGFITNTAAEGLPTYDNKGTYRGEISLSNNGLLGKGNIEYLWASIDSDDILFKPEQLLSTARNFDLEEQRNGAVEVPAVQGKDVSIDWLPYVDSMFITSKNNAFELFQAEGYTLQDILILTPEGLKGRGVFDSDRGAMISDLYSFGAFSVESDTANLQIKASGVDHLALDTKNVYAKLDFDKQVGLVKANAENVVTTLPYNEYQTSLNEYDWDMANETITFKSKDGEKGNFKSIHADQDSLTFDGETAFYNLKNNEMKIGGVEFIHTADALVYPDAGKIEIKPGGVIPELTNAKIVANSINKNHVINRANVKIKGKNEYHGNGFYEYNVGDKKQEIEFTDIRGGRVGKGKKTEKRIITKASGNVYDDANFYIDYKTKFRGEIFLSSAKKDLALEGFALLEAENLPNQTWFSIKSSGDKDNLVLYYDTPKNLDGAPVRTGIFLDRTTFELYPNVMSALHQRKDRPFFEAKGAFKYNKLYDDFIFGDSTRVLTTYPKGNLFTFSNKDSKATAVGKFNVGEGLEYIDIHAYGQASSTVPMDTVVADVTFELVAGIDMYLPEDLTNIIISDLQGSAFDAPNVMHKPVELYENFLTELIPDTKAKAMSIAELKSANDLVIPAKYNKFAFLLTELAMEWNTEYQTFVTKGKKIGLSSVSGVLFNKSIEGYLEVKMPGNNDDRMYMYLKSPSGYYYFFGYKEGVLNTVSDNPNYTEYINNMKKKDKSKKMKDGEFFEIQPVEEGTADLFLKRIKAIQSHK